MKRLIKSILILIFLKLRRWFYIPIKKESRDREKFEKFLQNYNRKQKRKIASVVKSHKFKLKVREYERRKNNKIS